MTAAVADPFDPPTLSWPESTMREHANASTRTMVVSLGLSFFDGSTAGLSGTTSIPIAQANIICEGSAVLDALTQTGPVAVSSLIRTRPVRRADTWEHDLPGTLKWLHQASGLTWDQLGRALGVSRRAVHLWANGGRMNALNAENLNALAAIVRDVGGDSPDETRAALLAPRAGSRSLFDEFRGRTQSSRGDIAGSPYRPDQLVGALHDQASPDS